VPDDFVCCLATKHGQAVPIGDFRKVWYNRAIVLGYGKILPDLDRVPGEPLYLKPRGPRSKPKPKMIYQSILVYDLRRTGVRNLTRAGVMDKLAMEITGHKTRSVFDRHNIVSGKDIEGAPQAREVRRQQNGANSGQIAETETTAKSLTN
jgi:hypothetical protein